jgi:hypothetical protein
LKALEVWLTNSDEGTKACAEQLLQMEEATNFLDDDRKAAAEKEHNNVSKRMGGHKTFAQQWSDFRVKVHGKAEMLAALKPVPKKKTGGGGASASYSYPAEVLRGKLTQPMVKDGNIGPSPPMHRMCPVTS